MAYKKWDIVWVYWLHIDKIKNFLNIELCNFWKKYQSVIEKYESNTKTKVIKKIENNNNILNETIEDFKKIDETLKKELDNNLKIKEKTIILLDYYQQIYKLLIIMINTSKEQLNLLKNNYINDLDLYKLFYLINDHKDLSLNIEVLKNNESIYRPCVIFHRSSDYYWVMPIHTIKEDKNNYNSKFDILLNKKSIIKCCSFEKTHISLIKDKKIINNKDKIDNLDLQNKITEKFNWFFLK